MCLVLQALIPFSVIPATLSDDPDDDDTSGDEGDDWDGGDDDGSGR